MRQLVRYEIADGCPQAEDKIHFSIPLKGMENVTPTLKNVFNKFSVRYFIKLGIQECERDDESKVVDVLSNPYELILYK